MGKQGTHLYFKFKTSYNWTHGLFGRGLLKAAPLWFAPHQDLACPRLVRRFDIRWVEWVNDYGGVWRVVNTYIKLHWKRKIRYERKGKKRYYNVRSAEADDRYLLRSDAPAVIRGRWRLTLTTCVWTGCGLCLTPQISGRLALKLRDTQAARCLALPGLAEEETGRVDRWSREGTGSASSSCILLHSNTSRDTQLQRGKGNRRSLRNISW